VSLADHDLVHDANQAPGAPAATSRAAAVAKLVAAVQTHPGHVVVVGKDAKAAAGLFDEAEAHLATYRGVRVRGRALDGNAAVAALCADKEHNGSPEASQRSAMQALIGEARAAALPVVVVVAEADAAGAGELERFREVVECVSDATDVVRMVLLGGPRLIHTVRRSEARSPATRVAAVVHVPDATGAPGRRGLGRWPTGVAGRYARAAALGGVVMLAAWTLGPKLLPPRDDGTGPPVTPPVAEPGGPLELVPLLAPSEAHEAAPATAPSTPSLPAPKRAASPPPARTASTSPRPERGPALQVGAFLSAASAEALRQRLGGQFADAYVSTVERSGSTYHRVRLGRFASEADLRAAETALRKAGYAPIRAQE
jgi:cell division septation protein DedD